MTESNEEEAARKRSSDRQPVRMSLWSYYACEIILGLLLLIVALLVWLASFER